MRILFEKIGALVGKLANLDGLISGMLSTLDARIVANAVNKNGEFMGRMIGNLDPKTLGEALNSNPRFMISLIKELNPAALADALNKNIGFMTRMIEALNPSVFTDSAGVVIAKLKDTFRPVTMAGGKK
jgi:hypothetical protein